MKIHIITVSDRASRGEYEDRSGPRIRAMLEEYARARGKEFTLSAEIVADEVERLREALLRACGVGADVVITTGGTGVGPRDITPEVVLAIADKTIPGIMEHIRLVFGQRNPLALLSRSVAAVRGRTVIYALPGSVKAVEEYVPEILKTVEHVVGLVRGAQVH